MGRKSENKEQCPYNEGCARTPKERDCEHCGWKTEKEKNDGKE